MKFSNLIEFHKKLSVRKPFTTLFQPFDHVFYFPTLKRLVVVHHDGQFVDYQA